MIENWRTIPDWSLFEVSDLGRVRRRPGSYYCSSGRVLKTHIKDGYPSVHLRQYGREKQMKVHIAVLLAFVGEPPTPAHETAHWDGNRGNATLGNLRWATHRENEADKVRHGTLLAGDTHRWTRLTDTDVARIKTLRAQTNLSYRKVADIVGCSTAHAHRIVTGQRRAHP